MLSRAAGTERDGIHAALAVEARIAGAVLAQELAAVPLRPGGALQRGYLRAVQVGTVRLVGGIQHGGDTRLAEALQVRGDLLVASAVQIGVTGREPDVEPCLRLGRDLVAGLVGGAHAGQADRRPPGLPGRHRIDGKQPVHGAVQLEQRVVAQPGVGAVRTAALRVQRHPEDPLGLGDDPQPAGFPDDDELAGDALLHLMPRPVPPAGLLVGDQLQAKRIGECGGQLAEHLRLDQPGDLHVLGAARVQPAAVAARAELARRGGHDVQVRVQHDPEPGRPRAAVIHQRAGLAAGLEPLHREPRPGKGENELQRALQLSGPVTD